MTDEPNRLGEFLRARRDLITPEQAGIPSTGNRRVPGLRREEVAMLAGISAEYYLRLEQGRDRRPSAQILLSVARVLQLDAAHTDHLLSLTAEPRTSPRPRRPRPEAVPASTQRFVQALALPAFVEGRYLDVLAANELARALSPRLSAGRNRLRDVFLDPEEQALFSDWEGAAQALLAGFRQAVGPDVDDPRAVELVGSLTLASPSFQRLWARHDVAPRAGATVTLRHPEVGELRLDREKLAISGTDGMMLVAYHPEPGTASAEKLALLASMAQPGDAIRAATG